MCRSHIKIKVRVKILHDFCIATKVRVKVLHDDCIYCKCNVNGVLLAQYYRPERTGQ